MFWFNQLMGSILVLFQVVIMTQLQLSYQPLGEQDDAQLNAFGLPQFQLQSALSSEIINSFKWDVITIYVSFVIPVVKPSVSADHFHNEDKLSFIQNGQSLPLLFQ